MGKICKRCEQSFYPSGKAGKICEDCQNKSSSVRKAKVIIKSKVIGLIKRMENKIN